MRKWCLLLGTVLSLFTMGHATAQTNLRVMCWNIMEGDAGLDALGAEINRQNPDIVLLNAWTVG